MNITVYPGKPLRGEVTVLGDKSISHRAALLAALADGDSEIRNFLSAGVTQVMLKALKDLGVSYEIDQSTLIVHGRGIGALRPPEWPIDCGNSATTLRLLAGFLAAVGIPAILDGKPGLRKRPMARIVDPLKAMGVPIYATDEGTAPLVLLQRPAGRKLQAIDYEMPIASAQVKSTLLLAALAANGPCLIHEPDPTRDHTELMMQSLGINITNDEQQGENDKVIRIISLTPPDSLSLSPISINIPGDFSSAAFLIVGASIVDDSNIKILRTGINPTRTGLNDAMLNMGAAISISGENCSNRELTGDISVISRPLVGIQIQGPLVVRMIDEFPAFTTAAVFASGRTEVSNAEELRFKESDRIKSLVDEFRNLGAQILEKNDGFIVHGDNPLRGGNCGANGDHRLVMALTIAGLAASNPVTILGAEAIYESFPNFIDTLQQLGAAIKVEAS